MNPITSEPTPASPPGSWNWIEPEQLPALPEPEHPAFGAPADAAQESENVKRLRPARYLRKSFRLTGPLKEAKLYATAHGLYRLFINGSPADGRVLAPEVTPFDKELTYQEYDITALLRNKDLPPDAPSPHTEEHVIGVILTDGWHIGRIGLVGDSCQYADKLAFLCQINVTYTDGRRETLVTDESWHSFTGPLDYSDLYIGERYNANKEVPGWNLPGFEEANAVNRLGESVTFDPVRIVSSPERLVPQTIPPVLKKEAFPGTKRITPKGEAIYDFGQVIAGMERICVRAPRGTVLKLEHSEVLDKEGNFIRNIGGFNKNQTDFYVCRGEGAETYEPIGTFHGFRYLKISAELPDETGVLPDNVSVEWAEGHAIRTDLRETASFSCSEDRLNRLFQNILWSLRGNTISIPTDCPQRERSGFTGDMQIIIETACYLMDMRSFAASWLHSVRLEQTPEGEIPIIAPNFPSLERMQRGMSGTNSSCGWGDAITIVPWTLYEFYGSRSVLEENYAAMAGWLRFVGRWARTGEAFPKGARAEAGFSRPGHTKYLWNTGFSFGDWLVPSRSTGMCSPFATADETKGPVGTAYFAHSVDLAAKTARVLGREKDAVKYDALAERIRVAYVKEYYQGCGRIADSTLQGIYVTALAFRMIPEPERSAVTEQLVRLIAENGFRLDTGFLSVSHLMDVLCDNGRSDVAMKLLFQTECPSWLYEVERGATTMWESWSAILPDGTVTNASYNHYAFGCVAAWMMRRLAGIRGIAPGFSSVEIAPLFSCGLNYVSASYDSAKGTFRVEWRRENGRFFIRTEIPDGVDAVLLFAEKRVSLPAGASEWIFRFPQGGL